MARKRTPEQMEKNREWQTHFNHTPEGKAARARYNEKRHAFRVCIHEETDRELWEALDPSSEIPVPVQIKQLAKLALVYRHEIETHSWQTFE